ncbi:hypothetical protein NLM25_34000 [Bradyrhizobium sp. CCGB01]|nr:MULTISPECIES: hypothetical protein [unclassified Bradyrhizobium]MCP3402079.1 hypothetical protein [Bradyrhizobium sp. CCGB20]MCP3410567.1 hypothetical protein [Bradyrhizobium sp. CCGB01]
MPHKNPDAERFGGPGSSRQDRKHPEKGGREHDAPAPGAPTNSPKSQVSGGGGERDQHHTHDDRHRS